MAVVAYCRVSTGEQSLEVQEQIVCEYGADRVIRREGIRNDTRPTQTKRVSSICP